MNSSGTAIFIEPQGTLLEVLLERKAWLEQTMPGQAFCGHPPHCTVLFGAYGSPIAWLESLRQQIGALPVFELETNDWQQFPRDALAWGGCTVTYRVRLTSALSRVQQTVAGCLAPFPVNSPVSHPLAGTEPFASSLRKFGSPFVGPHWIPHFTIGSPLVAPEAAIVTQLMSGSARHRFFVRKLSVWRVEGDRHERLNELALADAQI